MNLLIASMVPKCDAVQLVLATGRDNKDRGELIAAQRQ
jgi:hypothetical protein